MGMFDSIGFNCFNSFNLFGNGGSACSMFSPFANMLQTFSLFNMFRSQNAQNYGNGSLSLNQRYVRMKLSPQSMSKIRQISQELNCNPNDLVRVIYSESGGNPRAINPKTGASGLIQFMPATAASMGKSIWQIRMMSAEQQLDLVAQYLKRSKNHAGFGGARLSAGQLYALVTCPGRAGRSSLYKAGSAASRMNGGLTSAFGDITWASLEKRLDKIGHSFKSFIA